MPSSCDIAIRAEGLGKAYRLGVRDSRSETLMQAAAGLIKAPLRNFRRLRRLDTFSTDRESADILWALRDVSFEIARGEVVGFVGRNGAGKSTLLKVLSRITEPTEGRALLRGRISSLLEVGTGFHPELTGRENVYMNGTILGMKRAEIDRKFDEIVAFSGIERFLDTPIKRYSSGMKVRLAFSVAAHLEPELLIVDEVLAVGDAEFQRRCLGKMQDVAGHGRTVLFVSHNMATIQSLCTRAISLQNGRIVADGDTAEVVRGYLASMNRIESSGFSVDNPHRNTPGDIVLTGGRVLDSQGAPSTDLIAGEAMTLELDYDNPKGRSTLDATLLIFNGDGIPVLRLRPVYGGATLEPGRRGVVRCTLPRLPLPLGQYRVAAFIQAESRKSDNIANALFFSVQSSVFYPTGQTPTAKASAALVEQCWEARPMAAQEAGLLAETAPSPAAAPRHAAREAQPAGLVGAQQ